MFQSARLKLALWYLLVIVCINFGTSALFYTRTVSILDIQFAQIEREWQLEKPNYYTPLTTANYSPLFLAQYLEEVKSDLIVQLFIINVSISFVVGVAGYLLSGKTLTPIQVAHEAQKQFLSDAAHELRTPIAALRTAFEVNEQDPHFSKDVRLIFKENIREITRLQGLTERILQLTRHDEIESAYKAILAAEPLAAAISHIQPLAQKKGIKLLANLSPSPAFVEGAAEELQEVFTIILDNAIKYSAAGTSVHVDLTVSKSRVVVRIRDGGIGITKRQLPHIFERFYRGDEARSTKIAGYGLGLSLAKKIVLKHAGTIRATSKKDMGSVFTVSFPLTEKSQ